MYSTKFFLIKLDKRPFKYTHANIKKKNKELNWVYCTAAKNYT